MRLLQLSLGLLLFGTLFVASKTAVAKPPNIVFILADDLGIYDLACYGRKEHNTPNLDAMAKEGLLFREGYAACPVCSPTRAAFLTGRNPAALRLTSFLPGRGDAKSQKFLQVKMNQRLDPGEGHLVRDLKSAGYKTCIVGKWHLGGAGSQPKDFSFDEYFPGKANTKPSENEGSKGEYELTNYAIEFIKQNKSEPFFLFLSHNNPHIPFAATPEQATKFQGAFDPTYAAVVETLDDSVGRIMKTLRELKLNDSTWVIFTSDNGGLHVPEGPHQVITHCGIYRAGKGFLYEGGIRVPVIVTGPGVQPGSETSVPMSTTDWRATFLALANITGTNLSRDGADLSPVLLGKPCEIDRPLWWHLPHYTNQGSRPSGAIRSGPWKYVEQYEDPEPELYDLSTDPGEQKNIAAQQEELVKKFREQLSALRKQNNVQENEINTNFDEAVAKRLYRDFDASLYNPLDEKQRNNALQWRRLMNQVVSQKVKP